MRIITCASYCGTGSSAVTDLFTEFDNCSSVGDHEFRFIHDPDGVRDLEYNLIENNNRHNTSNAIKRYIKFVKQFDGGKLRKGYKRYMGDAFMKYSMQYVSQITELKSDVWWYYDAIEKGRLFYCVNSIFSKLAWKIFHRRFSLLQLTNEKSYFSAINKETFYTLTKTYVENVIGSMNKNHSEFVMVDQLLPPSNLNSYLNYFTDIRVVVVERDPRDIFLCECEVWRGDNVIPHKDVYEFCKWYEITRRHRKKEVYDSKRVYFLQFEDLIYKYDEVVPKLIAFVGLEAKHHIAPKTHLDPAVSIHNTNLKKKYPKYKADIQYIESHLKQFGDMSREK